MRVFILTLLSLLNGSVGWADSFLRLRIAALWNSLRSSSYLTAAAAALSAVGKSGLANQPIE